MAGFKKDFWHYMIVLGALIIIVWALLKALNIIHSPTYINMIPYIGAGISLLGFAYSFGYKFGGIRRGIDETDKKVDRLVEVEKDFLKLKTEHQMNHRKHKRKT